MKIRHPAVAGQFYPIQAQQLSRDIHAYIDAATVTAGGTCRGVIVPHAGYPYSGPIAGMGYAVLARLDQSVPYDVVILAPSHRAYFRGAALSGVDVFRTPLGDVSVERPTGAAGRGSCIFLSDEVHAREHAVEVQLPFLQIALRNFRVVPLILGDVDTTQLADEILAMALPHPLYIASSDLSHYDPYDAAVAHDRQTIALITGGKGERLTGEDACGFMPIQTLLAIAHTAGWKPRLLDYRNSGDTAGDTSAVVGYTAISFEEA